MKKHQRYGSTIALILIILIAAISASSQNAPLEDLDEYVNKSMADWKVPGLAIAVVKDDKIIYAKGFGVRKLGEPEKVTKTTVFAIGSSSKAFTSAALAILADEKKLKWDDRVTKFLPDFELYDPYVTREMTVRDMLTHRIGLERGDQLWYATDYSRKEVLRRIRYLEPSSSVRSRFGYQNVMYLAAGQIIPSITSKTWDQFVAERIFSPLGMKNSGTSITTLSKSNDVATPHAEIDDKVIPIKWRLIDNIGPAGSINSDVVDMAQWVRLQLGKGKYDGKQLISAANIKEMQMSQTVMRLEGSFNILYPAANFLNYGMGWFLSDFNGKKVVEHGGAIDGMRAQVAMIPDENIGVIVLTNMNGSVLPHMLMYRVFDDLMGKPKRDWSGEAFKSYSVLLKAAKAAQAKALSERVKGTKPSLDLKKYAGKYRSEMYGDTEVKFADGKLTVQFGPNYFGELEHWHYDTFQVTWRDPVMGKGLMPFSLDTTGKVADLGFGPMGKFERLPEKKVSKVTVDRKVLEKYVGEYQIETPKIAITITLANGKLFGQVAGQPKAGLSPESETKFFFDDVDAQITFVKDETGKVTGLALSQGGAEFSGKKIS